MTAGHVYISDSITEARHGHAWRAKDGSLHADMRLGASYLVFDDAATARQVAAACTEAAEALDALEAESESDDGTQA